MKRNKDIREALFSAEMRQWQLAEAMGINEVTLCKKLREELPEAEKRKILELIKGEEYGISRSG